MRETFEQLVARINASAYIPGEELTAMAKQVKLAKGKEFTFAVPGNTQASKYPWDEWFGGNLLLLERSEGTENDKGTITEVSTKRDYEVPTEAMLPKLKTAARRKYKVVQVSRRDADGQRLVDALIIRARDMTVDERVAEDLLRAEEKADRKAAKEDEDGADLSIDPATVPATQVG